MAGTCLGGNNNNTKPPIWTRPFLDQTDWVQFYGYTRYAKNQYSSTGGLHPGLDYGRNHLAFGFRDRETRLWDFSQYGTDAYPLIPVYAGCYCTVQSTKAIEAKETYHPGQVVLTHGDYPGLELLYGHLQDIPQLGGSTTPDTIIGYLKAPDGQNIDRFDAHVHVEVRHNGQFINPIHYLSTDLQSALLAFAGSGSGTQYRGGFPSNPYNQPSGYYGQPVRLPHIPPTSAGFGPIIAY